MINSLARLLSRSSIALLVLASFSQRSEGQYAPYPCPTPYNFYTYYDFISARNYHYSFRFTGGPFVPLLGPTVGYYAFPPMTSTNGEARLYNGKLIVHCVAGYFPVPPFAQPQLVIAVIDDDVSGDLEIIYPPGGAPDDACELNDASRSPGVPTSLGSSSKIGASVSTASSQSRTLALEPCDTEGIPGGGESEPASAPNGYMLYCLYLDYYSASGEYLGSELQYCWVEEI